MWKKICSRAANNAAAWAKFENVSSPENESTTSDIVRFRLQIGNSDSDLFAVNIPLCR